VPRQLIKLSVVAVWVTAAHCSNALTITSGPTFAPAPNAPQAGLLELSTDDPSRISIAVTNSTESWQRNFYEFGTTHSLPLLGFKPDRTNQITVTVQDKYRNKVTAPQPVMFITAPLPANFPKSTLLKSDPARMEPGYTLFWIQNRNAFVNYLGIVDNLGEVVWYSGVPSTSDVRQLANGDLFLPQNATSFVEINMLGNMVNTWAVPTGLKINPHEGVPTPHGTILYFSDASRVVTDFPSSVTDPNAPLQTTTVLYNKLVEISAADGSLLNTWSPIDVLDPRRLTYLTFDVKTGLGWDIEHCNAVIEDPRDNTVIVSMRNQNAVIKFYREDGRLKWILGPHENWGPEFQQYLLTPVGTPFEWPYGEHAPVFTPQGTLLLYDNGNARATPFAPSVGNTNNYSRAVEYAINEETMEITQVWDYGKTNGDRLYTDRVSNADWLPKTGNVLINFGYVIFENGSSPNPLATSATMVRIKEVTHVANPEVVFDLCFFDASRTNSNYAGYYVYRSHRIPDLYSTQAAAVADLTVNYQDGAPRLEFSANPARTYTVEASRDLKNWLQIGTPSPEAEAGNFGFTDTAAYRFRFRYYRMVSH
jgi:arylsulfate sulfotransferase